MSGVEMFYLWQGGFVGDDLLLWGKNRSGYTTVIEHAGQYTREEVLRLTADPARRDVAIPVAWVETHAHRVIGVPPPLGLRLASRTTEVPMLWLGGAS